VEEGPSDAQLVESFLVRRDEVAFEALLRRHGPMVLGVCQRVLRNVHDAEDALQATFLVLARKAGSIRSRQVVASWLYGVAYRTAMKARVMNAKRQTKEREAGKMTRSQSSSDEELLEHLDHELSRLPDKYRVPVVLCELEGRSRKEVARVLGLPEGTLSWRLAQAKKMLAKRLSRHELTIPLAALAVGLSPTLRASTLKGALTAGTVPAKVLALTEGVMKAMLLSKLKITVCVATLAIVAGVGATGLTYRATADEPKQAESYRKVFVTKSESGSAPDDLEALRLEIEALRKELRATKERVKTLEEANRRNDSRSSGTESPRRTQRQQPLNKLSDMPKTDKSAAGVEEALKRVLANPENKQATDAFERAVKQQVTEALEQALKHMPKTDKSAAGVEEALKRVLANPENKQATDAFERAMKQQVAEALEQALKQLKEPEKPRKAGPKKP
jgi:RNA polymerase sigma factor (sigma-70 family)